MKGFVKTITLVIGCGIILVYLTYVLLGTVGTRRLSTLTDETISFKHNKIPQDVLSWSKDQDQVLGIARPSNEPLRLLPKSLHVPILMFHYVEYVKDKGDTIRQSLDTTPYTLEQEIVTLQNAGYTFMTNKELTEVLDGIRRMPLKPILLTFDDGYRDFYTDAYPILKKYNVKATAYVITGFLNNRNSMTTEEVQEIATDGLVEIGAHTVHHAWLKGIPLDKLQSEIVDGKRNLEELIGKQVVSFAYPYGVFDIAAINAVHQAGFTSAVSTVPGIDQLQTQRYFLYRLRSGGRTGEHLLTWLENVKDEQVSMVATSRKN